MSVWAYVCLDPTVLFLVGLSFKILPGLNTSFSRYWTWQGEEYKEALLSFLWLFNTRPPRHPNVT